MSFLRYWRLSRPVLFGLLALILCASVFYSRAIRQAVLPSELQYMPQENSLLLASGGIEELWQAVERHFGEVIREQGRKGALTSLADTLREHFNEQNVPVNGLPDLSGYGLNLKRGALFSLYTASDTPGFVLLLHLQQQKPFTDFLSRLSGLKSDEMPLEFGGDETELFLATVLKEEQEDTAYLVHPQPGLALLSNSRDLLQRSLFNRKSNLAHALENDTLYEAVRQRLRHPLLSSPTLFLSWQPKSFPPIRRVIGILSFDADTIRLEADLELISGRIKVLDNLLEQPPPEVSWQFNFSREIAAAFVLHDQEIPRYLRFMSSFGDSDQVMQESYGVILAELRQFTALHQMVLAITGYRGGLPEMMLGIWGPPERLGKLITDLQIQSRSKRDRAILTGALEALSKTPQGLPNRRSAVAVLQELGLIEKEPDALFDRYTLIDGEVRHAALHPEDFQNLTYQRQYQRWTIEYIAPRLTENDLRYRPEFEGKDRETLLNDRFRLACVRLDGALWFATDPQDLEALLDRAVEGSGSLPQSPIFRAASSNWSRKGKLQGFLNMDQIITSGLLSSESWIHNIVKRYLFDLRNHPAVSLDVTAVNGENRIRISARMLRRSGLKSW